MKNLLFYILSFIVIVQSCNFEKQEKVQLSTNSFFKSDTSGQYEFRPERQTDFVEFGRSDISSFYEINCSSCHSKFKDNYTLGNSPVVRDLDIFRNYVTKQDSLMSVRDPLSLAVKQAWGNDSFIHNFSLSNLEIEALRNFLLQI